MTSPQQTQMEPWVPEDDFASRLLLIRRTLRLTLREAAERCGLNYRTWQTWEEGRRPQNMLEVVSIISNAMGVDRQWLAWGEAGQSARFSRKLDEPGEARFSGSDMNEFVEAISAPEMKLRLPRQVAAVA